MITLSHLRPFRLLGSFLLLLAAASGLRAQNLILNGGFETPSSTNSAMPANWSLYNSNGASTANGHAYWEMGTSGTYINPNYYEGPAEGDHLVVLAYASEAVQTVSLTAGTLYTLSYEFMTPRAANGISDLNVFLYGNGADVNATSALSSTYTASAISGYTRDFWTTETMTFTVATAGSYLLEFEGGSTFQGGIAAVDNVQLTGVSAVPEPATYALWIGSIGLVAAAVRSGRKIRSVAV